MTELRRNIPQDTPQLRQLWQTVFGDSDAFLDLFFTYYGQPGEAVLLEQDGTVLSALHTLPVGEVWMPNGTVLPFSYIYAVATAPAHRQMGYSGQVLQEALRSQRDHGYACSGLCIAEDELFAHYERAADYTDCFYVREALITAVPSAAPAARLQPAAPEAYNAFRNQFLQKLGRLHMQFHARATAFQKAAAQLAGGDLYLLGSTGSAPAWGCALVETDEDGTVLIKELLCPENRSMDALASIAKAYPAKQYLVRGPAEMHNAFDGTVRRCGQALRLDGGPALQTDGLGYYGLMFD